MSESMLVIRVLTFVLLATLYKSLGIGSHKILALAAVYGTVAFFSNALTTRYMTDQWGRRKYVDLDSNIIPFVTDIA